MPYCKRRQVALLKKREYLTVYAVGSIGYRFIEVLWRGRTHWTMGILGGVCFLLMYVTDAAHSRMRLAARALISAVSVTALEFFSGLLINRVFRLCVWDYSGMRFNLCGQISLLYSILWYFLCIPAHLLCRILRRRVFGALPTAKRHFTKIFERQPNIR